MVAYTTDDITTLIVTVRGKRVILDRDLAALYGVPTFRFNEAVKRNRNRFPEDFMFQLTGDEAACLTSQIAMSKSRRGGRRTLPYAFYRTRDCYGCQYFEVSKGHSDECFCSARVHSYAADACSHYLFVS